MKQTATDAINTLSNRLVNGRLLEDRRASILGLRSFAKEYPAEVASGALRPLIGSLSKDINDVDTIKIVLETLLNLFNPNDASPEASEELSLWLADEFTQRQDNITCLLDLLNSGDFYSRLYSLQLLTAIQAARLERTQECVFTAPLGITRLVAVLDDRREAIRNEGLLLLMALTPASPEIQKLVAFENGFDRVLNLMEAEGGLSRGGSIIQDCLTLLANLLRLNISNQSLFRETGCVPKLAKLVAETISELDSDDGLVDWAKPQRDKNIWGILVVLRLFLIPGGLGTQANQLAWWHCGISQQVLRLAFGLSTALPVRVEAFTTCADLIKGNGKIQETFAQLSVGHLAEQVLCRPSSRLQDKPPMQVNVIHGLLEIALEVTSNALFDVRMAACECLKAYMYQHTPIRMHFLQRTIEGYKTGSDDTGNTLAILLSPRESRRSSDPYRIFFASTILLHLIHDDPEAKSVLMSVTEGDASAGEEVVTCIQALTGALIAGLQRGDDERISVAYAMLLCCWLFEDPDAVNDFLGEASSVQSMSQAAAHGGNEAVLAHGMCSVLLGIVYEFSTKDSPVPRTTVHQMICSGFGREQYLDKLTRLREHPVLRDFEVMHQGLGGKHAGGLPDVYFDKTFVNFLKDNFSRLLRAIDRDPGLEIPVMANGVQKGISRELVDTLRLQVDDKKQALQKAEGDILTLERRLGQEQAELRRVKETAALDLSRIRTVNEGLQRQHEEELGRTQAQNRAAHDESQRKQQTLLDDFQRQIQQVQQEAEAHALQVRQRYEAEMTDLKGIVGSLEGELEKASKDHIQDLQTAHDEYSAKLSALESRLQRASSKADEEERRAKQHQQRADEATASKAAETEARVESQKQARKTQSELDDLLIVLEDIEEKRARDKKRLKAVGEAISDDEDDEEDDEEAEGGEDEDDGAKENGTNGVV